MGDDTFRRIQANTASSVLVQAVEDAEDLSELIVIAKHKAPDDEESAHYSFYHNGLTLENINWLLDVCKAWLMEGHNGG